MWFGCGALRQMLSAGRPVPRSVPALLRALRHTIEGLLYPSLCLFRESRREYVMPYPGLLASEQSYSAPGWGGVKPQDNALPRKDRAANHMARVSGITDPR